MTRRMIVDGVCASAVVVWVCFFMFFVVPATVNASSFGYECFVVRNACPASTSTCGYGLGCDGTGVSGVCDQVMYQTCPNGNGKCEDYLAACYCADGC